MDIGQDPASLTFPVCGSVPKESRCGLEATPIALADELLFVCVDALPHKLSQERGASSCCADGETGLGSEFRRGLGDAEPS